MKTQDKEGGGRRAVIIAYWMFGIIGPYYEGYLNKFNVRSYFLANWFLFVLHNGLRKLFDLESNVLHVVHRW